MAETEELHALPFLTSNESKTLQLLYWKLSTCIDIESLLPMVYSMGLINDRQLEDCKNKSDVYKKAEAFLDILQRIVSGKPSKFYIFLLALDKSNQESIASLIESTLMQLTSVSPTAKKHYLVIVPDTLAKKLVDLRFAYSWLLVDIKSQLLATSNEYQDNIKELLCALLQISTECDLTHCLFALGDKMSIFNVYPLKKVNERLPEDIRSTAEQLIGAYEQKCEVLMTSDTLSQFKTDFPDSSEQTIVTVKLHNQYMKHKTLDDLQMLMQKVISTDETLQHFASVELQPTCCALIIH